jgi:hypothetical protein
MAAKISLAVARGSPVFSAAASSCSISLLLSNEIFFFSPKTARLEKLPDFLMLPVLLREDPTPPTSSVISLPLSDAASAIPPERSRDVSRLPPFFRIETGLPARLV